MYIRTIFIVAYLFFSMQAYGAERKISINYSPYVLKVEGIEPSVHMVKISRIFFNTYADLALKKKLVEVSDFFKYQCKIFFDQLKIYDLIDLLYEYKKDQDVFQWLSDNSNLECKNALKNSYIYGWKQYTEYKNIQTDRKKEAFKNIEYEKNIFDIIRYSDNKEHLKDLIPYSSTVAYILALERDMKINPKAGHILCFDPLPAKEWIDKYKIVRTMVDNVCSFFDRESSHENFSQLYESIMKMSDKEKANMVKAAYEKQIIEIPIIVLINTYLNHTEYSLNSFLRKESFEYWMKRECNKNPMNSESDASVVRCILSAAKTCDEQIFLMKSGWCGVGIALVNNIKRFIGKAMSNDKLDEAIFFLEIYYKLGYCREDIYVYNSFLKDIITNKAKDIVRYLVCQRVCLSEIYIEEIQESELKSMIELCSDEDTRGIFSQGPFLHKAVKFDDAELVKKLLELGADSKDHLGSVAFILPSCSNQLFDIFLDAEKQSNQPGLSDAYSSSNIDDIIRLVTNNSEKNIIKLFTRGLIKPTEDWRSVAKKYKKYGLRYVCKLKARKDEITLADYVKIKRREIPIVPGDDYSSRFSGGYRDDSYLKVSPPADGTLDIFHELRALSLEHKNHFLIRSERE